MNGPPAAIAVQRDQGGVRIVPAPPTPSAGEPFTILRAGVCGTDLQIAARLRGDRARILGHEALAATPVSGPVVLNPVGVRDQDSILGHSYDGVFRRCCPLPQPDDGGPTLVPAHPELIADLAPLTEPLGAALYGWELVEETRRPATVAVWGGGFLGLACAAVARLRGAEVVVFCSSQRRADWIRSRSGLRALGPSDSPGPRAVDAAFLCVPRTSAADVLGVAAELVRADGVVDLVGGVPDGVPVGAASAPPGPTAAELRRGNVRGARTLPPGADRVRRADGRWWRVTGHRGTSDAHLLRAQQILLSHPELFVPLVTHVVSLHHGAQMINRVCVYRSRVDSDGGEIVKVVIDPAQDAARRPVDPAVRVGHLVPVA